MTISHRILTGLRAVLLLGSALAANAAQATDAEARAILKGMSDYIGALSSLEASVDTALEIVTPEMEKISYASSSTIKLNRPGELKFERRGALAEVEFLYDGKTLTIRDRGSASYGQIATAGTVNALVKSVEETIGLVVPGADLLLTDSYSVLAPDILEAKVIGSGVIGGQLCDHVAFRNFDTDWQLWVRAGPEKVPCKMIITSKLVGMAPQYTVHVRSWTSNPKFAAGTFAFRPASGERRIDAGQMSGVDEIPPPIAKGDSK